MLKKAKELFGNEEFVKAFEQVEEPEKLVQLFSEYGVEVSEDDVVAMIQEATVAEKGEEISETDLYGVSGGIIRTGCKLIGVTWAFAVDVYGSPEKAVDGIVGYWSNAIKKATKKKKK